MKRINCLSRSSILCPLPFRQKMIPSWMNQYTCVLIGFLTWRHVVQIEASSLVARGAIRKEKRASHVIIVEKGKWRNVVYNLPCLYRILPRCGNVAIDRRTTAATKDQPWVRCTLVGPFYQQQREQIQKKEFFFQTTDSNREALCLAVSLTVVL